VNATLQRLAALGAVICALLEWSSAALAHDATLDMGLGRYDHRAWKFSDGFATGPITAITQTPDGYLWLGSRVGLWRFDGVRAVLWQAPEGKHLPNNWVQALAPQDKTLWIGTGGGLVSWRDGKLTDYPALAGLDVLALLVDREGTVWVGTESRATNTGRLCSIRDKVVHCYGEDGSLGGRIYCLYEDGNGNLWFASSSGVGLWRPGKPKIYPMHDSITGYFESLTAGADGGVLFSALDGLKEIVGGAVHPFPLPASLPQVRPPWLITDGDGALWLGTLGSGLWYVHAGRLESFSKSDGLSGDRITKMFEDREGNIWIATQNGLDEFWKVAAATFSDEPGLADGTVNSVLGDRDGNIWFATTNGLYRYRNSEILVYRGSPLGTAMAVQGTVETTKREIIVTGLPADTSGSLYQDHRGRIWLGSPSGLGYLENDRFISVPGLSGDYLNGITEDDRGNVWISGRALGLFRVTPDGKVQRFPWAGLGIGQTWSILYDPSRQGLWVGSILGEIAFVADGKIGASYAVGGHGKQAVKDFRLDPDGTLWVSTEDGLIRLKNGHLAKLNSKNGLPCDIVHATLVDDADWFWLYTACGLVRTARSDLDAWLDSDTHAPAAGRAVSTLILGASDGIKAASGAGNFSPKFAKSRDGRLWIASSNGTATVDPRDLSRNTFPPPVHIEKIIADHKSYGVSPHLMLPPLVRDLEIDYTALSFVAPQKNQFRYKLEGRDRDWQDAGNRRQTFYTDLAPGNYSFRVTASNNSDVWNNIGATLNFSIAPAYWQTSWFIVLCAIMFATLLAAIYQLRIRQLARATAAARDMQTQLAHANRLATMGQLTASIAHEVNQPLAAAVTNAQAGLRWLKRQPPDLQEITSALEAVVEAADRGADVVTRIHALVKKAPAQDDDVYLNDAITGVLSITHGEAVKHQVTTNAELAPDLPSIRGDRVQLQQVLLNLIVNAIEAMSTLTDGPRELVVRSERDGVGGIIVSVQDTGPGLEPEAMERLFQPFYTSKQSGLGLGLAICQSIIEAHGGRLSARANAPRGAVFQFTLAAKRP